MNKKRLLALLALCLCLVGTGIPARAQTVEFDITVGRAGNTDPLSKRAMKADNEQKFYVTATGFRKGSGAIRVYSHQLNNKNIGSEDVIVSSDNIGRRLCGEYWSGAVSGVYYYMESDWESGASTLRVVGRYTP